MDNPRQNDETPVENGLSENPDAADLDEDVDARLRGDAIGDTMYSQTFVAKTLLKLSEVEWNEELEEDLCSLWDMTVEREVCAYLFDLSYPSIASAVVQTNKEERLVEIVVGILANIFCASCEKRMVADDVKIIIQVLDSDDPLILIQVCRFVKAMAHFDEELEFLSESVVEKLSFILRNALNSTLLSNCLDTVATLCSNDNFTHRFLTSQLYDSSLTAYQTFCSKESEDFFFESTETQTAFAHLMTVITGFTSHVDAEQDLGLLQKMQEKNRAVLEEIRKVLHFYANDFNLLPFTDNFKFFIESFGYNFPILCVDYDSSVFKDLMQIVITLMESESLDTDDFSELLCYLVSKVDFEQLKNDTKDIKDKDIVSVLEKFRNHLEGYNSDNCKKILSLFK